MGLNCDYQRDPCVELASNVHMGGNMACNVANGGICRGTLGTNTYHCQLVQSNSWVFIYLCKEQFYC